jgi:tyrosyl-tRNA synthetase
VTTADGKKMGKTEKGALFLDPALTSPYEFFQYWRNVQDTDVRRFLLMFTFLPVEECEALSAAGKNPNGAKERLAWELTALIHGREEADKALAGARAAFGGGGGDLSAMPQARLPRSKFEAGYNVVDLCADAALVPTKSAGRRLVQQGGAFVGRPSSCTDAAGAGVTEGADAAGEGALEAVGDVAALIGADRLNAGGELLLRAGKKRYCRVTAS